MKIALLVSLTLILISCSSTPPTSALGRREKMGVTESLRKKDSTGLNEALAKYESISGFDRFDFLYESLNRGCFPDDIKLILSKNESPFERKLEKTIGKKNFIDRVQSLGQSPDQGHETRSFDIDRPGLILTSLAGQKLCYEGLNLLKDKVSAEDFADAVSMPVSIRSLNPNEKKTVLSNVLSEHFESLNQENDESVKRFTETTKAIIGRVDEDCKKSIKVSCDAKEELKKMVAGMVETENEKEYWAGPEGTLSKACYLYNQLQRQQGYVDYEKNVVREVGVANLSTLRSAGVEIVNLKHKIGELDTRYKKQTGRRLDFKNCE